MKVYGHRAAAGEAPENTVAGCRHAIERGCRYLELDLRLSADMQMVVVHDKKVNRTTHDRGAVSQYSARELAAMDARRDGPPWPGKKDVGIPDLDTVLNSSAEIKGYYLEVKSGPAADMAQMAKLIAERFPNNKASNRVVITSMNQKFHHLLRELAPHLQLGLISVRPDSRRELEELDYQHLILPWGAINALNSFALLHARKQGLKVAAWTANDPQAIRKLYRMKVDNVITDYPSMALPLVASLMR